MKLLGWAKLIERMGRMLGLFQKPDEYLDRQVAQVWKRLGKKHPRWFLGPDGSRNLDGRVVILPSERKRFTEHFLKAVSWATRHGGRGD